MTSVHLRNVSKEYSRGAAAVAGIDLTVGDGELLALVGASGSGKTTLLRLIAGLEEPTRGSIALGVDEVTAWPPWRRQTAFVSEASSLLPHKTAAENLVWSRERRRAQPRGRSLWQRLLGWEGETPAEREEAAAWAARLGLTDVLNRLPQTLSAGQQQRVALGRALMARPRVLLLDEPLGRLDGPQRAALARELRQFQRRQGATWIYVTHDRREAASVADRIGLLDAGRLVQIGTPLELGEDPDSLRVAQWMAARPLNVLTGRFESSEMFACSWGSRQPAPLSSPPDAATRSAVTESGMRVAATWRANEGVLVSRDGAVRPAATDRLWWAGVVTELEPADGATWVWVAPAGRTPRETSGENEQDGDLCVEVSAASASWRRGDEVWAGFERARTRWFESTSGRRLR
ncbi:MAG: ABC transporter ATP-binding protein [Pirellulales bacterium]